MAAGGVHVAEVEIVVVLDLHQVNYEELVHQTPILALLQGGVDDLLEELARHQMVGHPRRVQDHRPDVETVDKLRPRLWPHDLGRVRLGCPRRALVKRLQNGGGGARTALLREGPYVEVGTLSTRCPTIHVHRLEAFDRVHRLGDLRHIGRIGRVHELLLQPNQGFISGHLAMNAGIKHLCH